MTPAIQRIITAIDFSPPSLRAMGYGIALALRFEAEFYLFHSLFAPQDALHNIDIRRRPQSISRQTAETRQRMADLMRSAPVPWQPLICNGPPVETIAEEATRRNADLVVAAGHGLSVMQKLFLGRVVDPMARSLACPLLIVKKEDAEPLDLARPAGLERIVIACDHRTSPDPVVSIGAYLAQAYSAEIHLFHALESPTDETEHTLPSAPYGEAQEALYGKRRESLSAQIPPSAHRNCRVQTVVRPGLPSEALTEYCRETEPDLIVAGVRRRGLVKKLMIGSTTEAVLHQRGANVLTVPLKSARQRRNDGSQ